MFRKGKISTEVDKGPFLFTVITLAGGAAATALLFILAWREPLAIFAGILLGIVTLAAGAVLFGLLTDKAYIDGDILYMSYMFKKRSIAIGDIGKITLRNEIYNVYDKKGAEAGTVNAKLTAVGDVILALDKSGVDFV